MHTRRARELCNATDGFLHFIFRDHHEICELVNDNDQLWQRRRQLCRIHCAARRGSAYLFVVAAQIANPGISEFFIAVCHLGHRPVQSARRLFRIRDHWNQKMRNAVIDREFHDFRVNHDELHFLWAVAIEDAHDQGVDAD